MVIVCNFGGFNVGAQHLGQYFFELHWVISDSAELIGTTLGKDTKREKKKIVVIICNSRRGLKKINKKKTLHH